MLRIITMTLDQKKIYPGMNEFDQQRIAKREREKTKTSGKTYAFARDKNKGHAANSLKTWTESLITKHGARKRQWINSKPL
jgi:hypothetical protein